MTIVMPPALAEPLAEAAGARLCLARPGPGDFVVTELSVALESPAPARETDRP